MASGLILGSNLVSQRELERDFISRLEEIVRMCGFVIGFFFSLSLPLHQYTSKSIMPNNIMFSRNLDVGCGKTIFQIRAYPRSGHFSVILLYL